MTVHFKKGFPDGSHKETLYEYNVNQNNPTPEKIVTYCVYIPGQYIGRDQMGDPTHPEQAQWLNSLSQSHKINIKEVWYGTWEIMDTESYIKFMALIAP